MIYTKRNSVAASMCDGSTKLSVLALFQMEEDAVTELMGDLHIDGITAMREYDAMWVFVKNTLRVFSRPNWREEYELRCFVSSHSTAKLLVDTELWSTSSNETLAHARLELCALDLQTGRIRKASTVGVSDEIPCESPLPELAFTRFPKESHTILETVKVRSTNLDYCSHTNNIEYLRFILNTYPAEHFKEQEITKLEIHYGNQTFEGDEIVISRHCDGLTDYFSLQSGQTPAADCMIVWSKSV